MKMKKIFSTVIFAMLTTATLSCEKDNNSSLPMPGPRPEPIPQQVSLVGTVWESVIEEDGVIDKSVLSFFTDSTGTEYVFLGYGEQIIDEGITNIHYFYDNNTNEGYYYVRIPEDGFTFIYNIYDTTLTMMETNRAYHLRNE